MRRLSIPLAISCIAFGLAPLGAALADDEYVLTIQNNRFEPTELTIPANTKVQITVKNMDQTAEEFESSDLNREKVVVGGGQIKVFVGPLPAGTYEFFGDFHPDTARGHIVIR
jgi:hypothetical protein